RRPRLRPPGAQRHPVRKPGAGGGRASAAIGGPGGDHGDRRRRPVARRVRLPERVRGRAPVPGRGVVAGGGRLPDREGVMTMPEAAPGWGEVPELGRPLDGLRVLDFSTLLPGPLATLLLAEAGADVLKVERPGGGDEMRSYAPRLGESSGNFALLNRGKRSVVANLKDPGAREGVLALAAGADVLVEQYRPGVMSRLGLGYADVSAVNPGIIYLSITGYGQASPDAQRAGHDLNYLAQAG